MTCSALILALAGSLTSVMGQSVTVNFENFAGMGVTPGYGVPDISKVSDQLLPTHGVRFSSEGSVPYVAAVVLGPGETSSGTKAIGGVSSVGLLSYFNGIRIEFFLRSSPTTEATTDKVSIRGDLLPGGGWLRMDAFDASGMLVGSDVQIDGPPATLSVTKPGIHSILLTQQFGNVVFDDLTFNSALKPAGPVDRNLKIAVSQMRLCWGSETNKSYQVQYRSELATNQWINVGSPIKGNGSIICTTDDVTIPHRFYQVITLP